jgi:predicted type IV restriction endonuclease
MAEVDGRPVLLRYALTQGQRWAIVRPGEAPVVTSAPRPTAGAR